MFKAAVKQKQTGNCENPKESAQKLHKTKSGDTGEQERKTFPGAVRRIRIAQKLKKDLVE